MTTASVPRQRSKMKVGQPRQRRLLYVFKFSRMTSHETQATFGAVVKIWGMLPRSWRSTIVGTFVPTSFLTAIIEHSKWFGVLQSIGRTLLFGVVDLAKSA